MFIEWLKSKAANAEINSKTVLVIGNESCDMDSCCSALAAAYLFSQPGNKLLPVMNIPRSEFRLRPDINYLFQHLGISPDLLTFKDEIELNTIKNLFLVDHNAQTVDGTIVSVIDHHLPEGEPLGPEVNPNVLGSTGSCMSLVVNEYLSRVSQEDASRIFGDVLFSSLCLAPILIDTRNLNFKMTEIDSSVVEMLKQNGAFSGSSDEQFAVLKARKSDINGFSPVDILTKDYKQWGRVGISSMPKLFQKLISRYPNFASSCVEFKEQRNLSIYAAVSGGTSNGTYVRQLAVVPVPGLDISKACPSLELKLEKEIQGVLFYSQGAITATRKQVAPLLRRLAL